MGSTHEAMTSSLGNKNYVDITVSALYLIYDLFYKNSIPNEIASFLDSALERAGGKDWKTSAEILYDAVNKIMDLNPEEDIGNKLGGTVTHGSTKSIFGKITGLFKNKSENYYEWNRKIEPVIFKINTASGSGTGFYIQDQNLVVTNYHVVSGYKKVAIEMQDKNTLSADVMVINPLIDIALLKPEKTLTGLPNVTFKKHDSLKIETKSPSWDSHLECLSQ